MDQYLSVSALTKYIKAKLEGDKHLFSILLKGEISNFKRHSRGHLYFTLKDENAQISAIMFSRDAERVVFSPKEGDHVLVSGRISLYEPSGTYSIQVTEMKPDGVGELYLKYEALKKDLEAKGYFSVTHKRPIPKYPKRIGVITSPTGAVIEDIKNTVSRRYLLTEIYLYPALVQGPGSADSIRNMIIYANQMNECDVLIVGRGGGSIEDLWSFNEMPVIQAIYDSKIPIITAIGHETDFTLSDFVSDLRAPTPTAAAELATPNANDLKLKIQEFEESIAYRISQFFGTKKTELIYLDQRLDMLSPTQKLSILKKDLEKETSDLDRNIRYLLEGKGKFVSDLTLKLKSPLDKIRAYEEKRTQLELRLGMSIENTFKSKVHQFDLLKSSLGSLNPLMLMDKGFAVIKKDERVLTTILDIKQGDIIDVRLKDGEIKTKVIEIKEINHGKEVI
jgi:exodeoxyribonuclease VII large subunit